LGDLLSPVAVRSATSRDIAPDRRAGGSPALLDVAMPPAPAPAAATGVAAASGSAPPPATYGLLVAALAVMALLFSRLIAVPARQRPVPFISLLERPG
jgi:hypothetical protein